MYKKKRRRKDSCPPSIRLLKALCACNLSNVRIRTHRLRNIGGTVPMSQPVIDLLKPEHVGHLRDFDPSIAPLVSKFDAQTVGPAGCLLLVFANLRGGEPQWVRWYREFRICQGGDDGLTQILLPFHNIFGWGRRWFRWCASCALMATRLNQSS